MHHDSGSDALGNYQFASRKIRPPTPDPKWPVNEWLGALTDVIAVCLKTLAQRLSSHLIRTAVLELNVARVTDRLVGGSSEERFRYFASTLRDPAVATRVLREYPVLARALSDSASMWLSATEKMLTLLLEDWHAILTQVLQTGPPGAIVEIKCVGDSHRGGQAVTILEFASGVRIVFKPRSTAAEVAYADFLDWAVGQGLPLSFERPRGLTYSDHSWVSFVERRACEDEAGVGRYFQRVGAQLAALHVLGAVDVHMENLIASGEYPIVVDAEALFHPVLQLEQWEKISDATSITLLNSVLRVGILPNSLWTQADGSTVDMSGVGGRSGQLSPMALPAWEGEGTDQMRLTRRRRPIPARENRPTVRGVDIDAALFADQRVSPRSS